MDNKNMSILVIGFVALLIGAALITTIASEEQDIVTKTTVTNESHTILTTANGSSVDTDVNYNLTNAPTGWKLDDCPIEHFVLELPNGTDLTLNTDYTFNTGNGTFLLLNTSTSICLIDESSGDNNKSFVNYDYCADDYVNLTWGRTVLNLVPGFFGLMLVAISIGLFYKVLKNEGLMNI